MAIVRRNVQEIAASRALTVAGALLASGHLLVVAWWWHSRLYATLAPGSEAICWPFAQGCADWRAFGVSFWKGYLAVHAAVAVASLLAFATRRAVGVAFALLVLLELARALVVVQDYQLRLNQHYMAAWMAAAFLWVPHKRVVLRTLLVSFYFWAGALKLNREWLTGAALYAKPLFVPDALLPAACAWVVLLELVVSFGLLAKRASVFWACWAQLALFAAASAPVVGFFYPLLMLLFLVAAAVVRSGEEDSPLRALFRGGLPVPVYGLLAVFTLFQLWPRLQPGDPALTGEGRWLALHMFDARVVCDGRAQLRAPGGAVQPIDLVGGLSNRIRCDPIVHLSRARALCRQMAAVSAQGYAVDVSLDSRRQSEEAMRPILRLKDFCRDPPVHHALGWNAWIGR